MGTQPCKDKESPDVCAESKAVDFRFDRDWEIARNRSIEILVT